jgi:hypothetical protein
MYGDSQREPEDRSPSPARHSRDYRPARDAQPQGSRVNRNLDLDELDPSGRARRAAKTAGGRGRPAGRGRKALRYAGLSMAGVLLATAGAGAYLYVHFNGNIKSSSLLPTA